MNAIAPLDEVLDFLIVGAGISGIGMAVHLTKDCPEKRYAILDRREQLGGTWDLFRYPGIRSDSDMHTLGFAFAPGSTRSRSLTVRRSSNTLKRLPTNTACARTCVLA